MKVKKVKAKRIYVGIVLLVLICATISACGKKQGKSGEEAKKDSATTSDSMQTPETDKEAGEEEKEDESEEQSLEEPTESLAKEEQAVPSDVEEQLRIIVKDAERWINDDTFWDIPDMEVAVTDLDGDDQLELIVAAGPMGTGLFTYSRLWYIDKGKQKLKKIKKNAEDLPDLIQDAFDVYQNSETGERRYVMEDFVHVSAQLGGTSIYTVYIKNHSFFMDIIGSQIYNEGVTKYYQYPLQESGTEGENGNTKQEEIEIAEKEYESLPDTVFANWQKGQAKISWFEMSKDSFEPDEGEGLSEEELYNKLKNSFLGFEVVWEKE